MRIAARLLIGLLLVSILYFSAIALLRAGVYGFTVFMVHPLLLGGLVSWLFPAESRSTAGWRGALAVGVAAVVLIATGFEGAACVFLSLPLTLAVGYSGGWLAYNCGASKTVSRGGMAMLLCLPPATLAYDTHAEPVTYAVTTSLEIAAPPQKVWQQIIHLEKFSEPSEWYFHTGLAYPQQVRLEGEGPGAMRYCEFTTGAVVESIEVWDAPQLLRFRVLQSPPPMREWTPYKEVDPKHLHGYLISQEGEFRLTPLPGNRTLLEGTSWYRHGLWPAQYWRVWSDAVFHRIHLRVFHQIQALAEQS